MRGEAKKLMTFRIPVHVAEKFDAACAARCTTMTDIIIRAMVEYAKATT